MVKFKIAPHQIIDNIPVFINLDDNPSIKEQYVKYIENYDQISSDHVSQFETTGTHFISENVWKELEHSTVSLINKYSLKSGVILDVGVGMGRLMSSIESKNIEKHGVDISLNYLRYASKKDITISLALAESLPYEDESFDMIVCTDVLEHVLDLNIVLREIIRCLKKGGILIIRVPYKEDIGKYLQPSCKYDYVHLRNFDEHNLTSVLSKIFNLSVLEYQLAGRNNEYYRFKYFLDEKSLLQKVGKFIYYLCKVGERFFRLDIKSCFHEYEINIVSQK